ncbi:MAG: dicarboxylate/amino acid:cation symporter [Eubacteriales bacterium]|nr:dicarboxylate/amino acid:cation symporter [Eubacteriales bacterium]
MMSFEPLEWGALLLTLAFFAVLYYLDKKKQWDFGVCTILATAFGIVVGLVFKGHYTYVAAFGAVYSRVISALVIPLLAFSIISSITNLGLSIRLKNIGWKTVVFLLLNTLTASVITLVAAIVTNVGAGFTYELATDYEAAEVPTIVDTLVSLFPQNLAAHWVGGEVVPIVIFLILVSIAFNKFSEEEPEKAAPFKAFIDAGDKVMGKVVSIVISFTPYAVLSLIARAVSRSSLGDLLPLLSVLVLAYVVCAIQTFLVEGVLLWVIGKLNPIPFFKKIWPAGVVAFTSQSSVGTIPVTVTQLKKMGVNEDIASFVASLGANLGMPGCAGMWPVLLAVFAVQILGITYTPMQYGFLIVLALIVAVGSVGVPGTATITATALFVAAGLPVEVIVLLSPVSSIIDMARTATNVVGAATAAVLVAATEENQLDLAAYQGLEKNTAADIC